MSDTALLNVNMLALSSGQPTLSVKLGQETPSKKVHIETSKNGLPVPVIQHETRKYSLHSKIDPIREGERFYQSAPHGGYLVFLGFGAGYHISPFLKRSDISRIVIIDFDASIFKYLLKSIDLRHFFLDQRVRFLIDPSVEEISREMLDNYLPAVSGNLQVLQLRSRVYMERERFSAAQKHIQVVIKSISEDYSVQSYFGKRWFVNSIRNLHLAETSTTTLPPVRTALITAAGPSLEIQLPELKQQIGKGTLIATDTSLPFLLKNNIIPDLVISIDCQHITYHHFMAGYPENVPLVLDLASPNHLTTKTARLVFFTSGHPFSRYVNSVWRRFPHIDTSGGNVSHAAVSLAEALGAQQILLFGADFSFPEGKSYTRGTYLYPFFHTSSFRTSPLEHHFFSFLLRNENIIKVKEPNYIRYTTSPMISYKKRLEQASAELTAELIPVPGKGEMLTPAVRKRHRDATVIVGTLFSAGAAALSWKEFIKSYSQAVESLPLPQESLNHYNSLLSKEQKDIVTTLLPAAAAIRRERELQGGQQTGAEILADVIEWTQATISAHLSALE
ncbi:MAG: 6-hydroxymethylpterin diphosphokinase MptE-like protein [Spirochaetia bacterium]|nr:6-hydroxymethylpterin diphosphokinase MptE-like protein [Spirochaetia bacterium]